MSSSTHPPNSTHLPQTPPPDFTDHHYTTKSLVALFLRLWPHPQATPHTPYIMWTHGGAYITGSHYSPPTWLIPALRSVGFHIITIGFRLAPQVWLPDMLQDCIDAHEWLKVNLSGLVHDMVDVTAFAIGGDSSGGSLACLLGGMIQGVKCVVDVYGPVDFTAGHFCKPPKVDPAPPKFEWSDAELEQALKDRDEGNAITAAPFENELSSISEKDQQDRWRVTGDVFGYSKRVRLQTAMKDYVGRRGPAVGVVLRLGDLDDEGERMKRRKEWSAMYRATKDYPPTVFLHGVGDVAVPIDQSRGFAKRLRELGVEVLESYEEEGVHGFDQDYNGPECEGWNDYIVPVAEFVARHTKSST